MYEFEVLGVDVNPLGLILAVVINIIVGILWYGPIFGKTWMKLVGKTKDDLRMKPIDIIVSIVLGLLMATGLNSVLQFANIVSDLNTPFNILISSGMIAFTFILPSLMNEVVWEGRNIKLIGLNWAHQFISLIAMSTVLAFFVL